MTCRCILKAKQQELYNDCSDAHLYNVISTFLSRMTDNTVAEFVRIYTDEKKLSSARNMTWVKDGIHKWFLDETANLQMLDTVAEMVLSELGEHDLLRSLCAANELTK